MHFDYQLLSAIALGIALSACCGFRVFIPMLAGSIASYTHVLALPGDMQWIGSLPALICFATAAVIELAAYYLPFLDNLLDMVATPLAIIAGTLLAAALIPSPDKEPLLRWVVALVAGGGAAGTIQMSSTLLRLFSTKATLGTGNPVIATGENVAAVGGSIFSFIAPIIVAAILLVIVLWILFATIKRFRSGKRQSI